MPKRKQKFKSDWLQEKDGSGRMMGDYLRPISSNDFEARCIWCSSNFQVSEGLTAVKKHCVSEKHKTSAKVHSEQTDIFKSFGNARSAQQISDDVCKAEIMWAIHTATTGSFNSANATARTNCIFKAMFPHDRIAASFACGKTKCMYLITHAVAPYLSEKVLSHLRNVPFTLCIDETNNVAGFKQLDLHAIYFCPEIHQVRVEFLTAIMLKINRDDVLSALEKCQPPPKLCSAKRLCDEIEVFMLSSRIPPSNVIAINRDGPSVMRCMMKMFQERVNENVFDFGSCTLHMIHNELRRAIAKLEWDVEEFAQDLKHFFKHQALRQEEFAALRDAFELPEKKLLQHSTTRFLTLLSFCERTLEFRAACVGYFVHYLPQKSSKDLLKSERFNRLRLAFSSKMTEAYLLFLTETLPIFHRIQEFLQRNDPIGPMFFVTITSLLARLGSRFLLPSVCAKIEDGKINTATLSDDKHLDEIDIGVKTSAYCKEHLTATQLLAFKCEVKLFYVQAFRGLTDALGLLDPEKLRFWRSLTMLHPESREFKNEKDMSIKMKLVQNLASCIPDVISQEALQPLCDEWKALAVKNIPDSLAYSSKGNMRNLVRLDEYWNKIFQNFSYPTIEKLVKACLCFQPHNAAVERGFSINSSVFTKERNRMSSDLLNAVRRLKSYLQNVGGLSSFPINQNLMELARCARRKYFEVSHNYKDVESDDSDVELGAASSRGDRS